MSFMDFIPDFDRGNEHRVHGTVIGVVTNNKDPENLGRVKLKLGVRFYNKETDWVRVAMPMAGKDKGVFFIPEVGDDVLVIFNEGDINEPYVIGVLWNSQDKPPESNEDGKNNIKKIKSRDGHEISISDKEDEGFIDIKTKNGNQIKIFDSGNGKIEFKDKSGSNKITIDGDGNSIEITGQSKVNVKSGENNITIDGTQNKIELKSSMQLSISAQMIEIKAGADLKITSDGMLTIKGTMVKIN